jgi:hypothetical protein
MALADVLAAITWPNISSSSNGVSPIGTTNPLRQQIESWIRSLYPSPTGAQILEGAAAHGNLNFVQTTGSTGAGQTSSGQWIIAINLSEIQNIYYFNDRGQLVHEIPELTLIHEVINTPPPGLNDPLPPGPPPSNAMMNAGFDFDGDTVRMQNAVARELGHLNNIQRKYYASASQGTALDLRFDKSINYSQGRTIDTPIIPENDGAGNDTLAPVTKGPGGAVIAQAVHLIFGLDGDDTLNGGGGSDYLYGGEDKDTFIGSDGDDLFHGGGTRDSGGNAVALDDDGIDTADYSAAAATEFIKITTDVAANGFHSGAIDATHRLLVQQTGAGKGTATIISIEKVKGTAGVDTFEVTQLVSAQ